MHRFLHRLSGRIQIITSILNRTLIGVLFRMLTKSARKRHRAEISSPLFQTAEGACGEFKSGTRFFFPYQVPFFDAKINKFMGWYTTFQKPIDKLFERVL